MSKTKSDKLKKLEAELADLERWLDLGLVPKKDLEKHSIEIESLKDKINEEKGKLTESKEGAEPEDYIAPKRTNAKQAFSESSSLGDEDFESDSEEEEEEEETEVSFASDDSTYDFDEDEEAILIDEEEEDDPFSDRNRWRRGVLEDPDSDNW